MMKGLKPLIVFAFAATFLVFISAARAGGGGDRKRAPTVTFSKDVAPIFYKSCVGCHRPNDVAPMSLLTYKEARPWARSIKEKVVTREMPPWHADPHFGEFTNDRRLSQKELDTVVAWVDQGAAEGNPKDLPPAPKFLDGWNIGKPDVVFSMAEDYTVAAEGADDYIYFRIPTNFKEDKWVQAIEFRPGNRKVVHHAVALIESPEMVAEAKRRNPSKGDLVPTLFESDFPPSLLTKTGTVKHIKPDAPVTDDGCSAPHGGAPFGNVGNELLCVYAPGREADVWPAGTAKRIPAGSNIVLQMHYSKTTGKAEKDRTSVGLIFARGAVEKRVVTRDVSNYLFKIPAGADSHEVTACWTARRNFELISYMPHMHVRGKDMKYEAVFPDGRRETLLSVPRYNFGWQTLYSLKQPMAIPNGTRFIVTAHYDNSGKNKYNPDPTKDVRYGEPTYEEMMIGFIDFVVPKPKDRVVAKLDPATYDAYVGQYELRPGASVSVVRDAGNLYLAVGSNRVQIFPESEGVFFSQVPEAEVTFVRNDKGEVTELIIKQNEQVLKCKLVSRPAPAGGKN
jgi:hypothetical protein